MDTQPSVTIQQPVNEEKLKELFEILDDEDLDLLLGMRQKGRQGKAQAAIREQLPDEAEIFEQLTTSGYFEGKLTVNKFVSMKLRMPAAWQFEDAVVQARVHANNPMLFERTRNTVQLAHMLIELNGESFGPMMPSARDYTYDDAVKKELVARARVVTTQLSQMSDLMLLLLVDYANLWQMEVSEKIQSMMYDVDEAVGNSTATPGT